MVRRAAGREAEAHPGLEMLLSIHKYSVTLEDTDELVLRAVAVDESG